MAEVRVGPFPLRILPQLPLRKEEARTQSLLWSTRPCPLLLAGCINALLAFV